MELFSETGKSQGRDKTEKRDKIRKAIGERSRE